MALPLLSAHSPIPHVVKNIPYVDVDSSKCMTKRKDTPKVCTTQSKIWYTSESVAAMTVLSQNAAKKDQG